ncbi:MAG TPA: TRAP transporter small permease subunit [Pseudolabrys sp.]|jgi:TRAP-type C4-dicarboxylate transport system permease small subunit|nr:TRAP transporter small permease subunit [Pseudolabrys sp.]
MNRDRALAALEKLRRLQLRLAAIALIVMMCVTISDVTLRYIFNAPIRGAYDLVSSMLVVFVFNGMSTAFLQRRNIVIDIIDSFAHRHVITVLIRIADVLAVLMLLMFAYAMITPAMQAYSYGDRKVELQLPIWILWVVAGVGIAGAIACAAGALFAPVQTGHHDQEETFE